MKIIPTEGRTARTRAQILDSEIQRLESEIGVRDSIKTLPLQDKKEYCNLLENFLNKQQHFKHVALRTVENDQIQDALRQLSTFHKFNLLPFELRLQIWHHILNDQPLIHCVHERYNQSGKNAFISNQPVSPLLRICQESRNFYFAHTNSSFAFETYINFATDTIYISDSTLTEKQFLRFLDCESALSIRKLAMRKSLYCALPMPEHMSLVHATMREYLPDWVEMVIVFDDDARSREDVWLNRDIRFRDLSAREKRRGAERGYARQWAQTLNSMMETIDLPALVYRFAVVDIRSDDPES